MKITRIKRVFAAVMAAAMLPIIPTVASASETPTLIVNESFNGYATYEQPDTKFSVVARNWYITEYEKEEKGLVMYASNTGSKVTFSAGESVDTVISFDMRATDVMPSGELVAYDNSGRSLSLIKFTEARGAGAYNGFPFSGFGKSQSTNYAIVFRADEKTCDIYVNGKCKISNMKMSKSTLKNISTFDFTFISEKDAQGVIIDNVNVYSDDKYSISKFPVETYNETQNEEIELKFGPQIGSNVLVNQKFEGSSVSQSVHSNGNELGIVEDKLIEGNHAYQFERQATGDAHFSGAGLAINSDSIVYEFDFNVLDKESVFTFLFKDTNGVFFTIGSVGKGPQLRIQDGTIKNIKVNKWYKVSMILNYYDRVAHVYFDGTEITTMDMPDTFAKNGASIEAYRVHMTHAADSSPIATDTDPCLFQIDNFRAYEGEELIEGDLGDVVREIDTTTKTSIFPDKDTAYKAMLTGYTAVHSSSGVVFVNNEKKLLRNTPVKKDTNDFMLPVEEFAELLGVGCTVNGTSATFNDKSVSGEIHDGVLYVNDDDLFNALGKAVTKVPSTYNANMVILGNSSFKLPDKQSEIDNLNDYLLWYRPTPTQFTELYNESELAGVHPRIQFTQADFDRMVELTNTDENMMKWKSHVISAADTTIMGELPQHILYDGLRMDCQRKLSKDIHCLAIAYYITKDQKYLDRAYEELQTVCTFDDWNPNHHLDTCEMMAAVAVGYDWLYNFFTEEQREVIEKGMYKLGLVDSYYGMLTTSTLMANAFGATNNHGTVDNTGLLMASLALMDVYPDACAWLGSRAMRGMELNIYQWAPEGFWYEGAGYWELTMQFTAKWMNTLDTVFPTDMGAANLEGLDKSCMAELQSQSPQGIYNFADAMPLSYYVPEMFYLANVYNIAGAYKGTMDGNDGKWSDNEDTALAMMWYDPAMNVEGEELSLDYMAKSVDTLMMRDSWDTKEPTFVGIHAGETNLDHSQMDGGSFIFDSNGVRWIKEIGMGDYNSINYFDRNNETTGRWQHLRSRAEAHSTIITSSGKNTDHVLNSYAEQTIVQQKPRGVISTVDMSQLLYDVSSATRGFAFTDNRQSLVVRDELNLTSSTDVYAFMISDASGTIDGNSIILTKEGKELKIEWTGSAPITAEYKPIEPLPGSPTQTDGWNGGGYYRLALRMDTSGEANITVKLTPTTLSGASTLEEWDKPISEWNIPDGEIPEKPMLDSIQVAGQTVAAGKTVSLEYSIVEGDYATPPTITATSDKYNVVIDQATSFDKPATVTVIDPNDSTNRHVYLVTCNQIKAPVTFDGKTSISVRNFEVSETPQAENPGINMFDGDMNTRWSAEGYGQWIQLDLGSVQRVDDVVMAFYGGNTRSTKLVFSVSTDGDSWIPVWNGLSSGTTTDYEFFNLGGVDARYIKIGCNGNTSGSGESWNSVTEVVVTRNN